LASSKTDPTLRVERDAGERLRREFASAPPPAACLVLIYGGELGRRFEIEGPLTIGREPASNPIVLESPDVSRQHAMVTPREGGWAICDLGSTNGTRVNDVEIRGEQPLASGDLVHVGGTIFKYIAGGNVESLFYDEIYRMTIFDGLTRVHNRRYLDEFLAREIARARRYHRSTSTTSSVSTTSTATSWATRCCARSPPACSRWCATSSCWPATAARSSRS
jgi:predicted component of type VI protein secretion system